MFDKISARTTLGVWLFLSMIMIVLIRANFSLILLAMVNKFDANGTLIEMPNYGPRNDWNVFQQGHLLAASYISNALSTIPMGIFIEKYGFLKGYVLVAYGMWALLIALSPLAGNSFAMMYTIRFLLGFLGGGTASSLQGLMINWVPPREKGKFVSSLFGVDLGHILGSMMSAYLIEAVGWKWAFYVPAILGIVFFIWTWWAVYDKPADHPRILPTELSYIESSLVGINTGPKPWPPIWSMMTSMPFWALLVASSGQLYGTIFLSMYGPKFISEILGFNIGFTGFLFTFPYFLRVITGFGFGALNDCCTSSMLMSKLWIRKGGCILSHIIPGLLLFGIAIVGNQPYWCIAFITVSYGFNGACSMTTYMNLQEIAPNFAGTISSIVTVFSLSTGFIIPMVVTYFIKENNTIDEWGNVFIVTAITYIVTAIFFMIFGSVDIQPWNKKMETPQEYEEVPMKDPSADSEKKDDLTNK